MFYRNSLDTFHVSIGQVDLVDDRNDLQIVAKGQVEIGHSLSLKQEAYPIYPNYFRGVSKIIKNFDKKSVNFFYR